jgi:hypothetical protein
MRSTIPFEERACPARGFLQEACGENEELRSEVRSLLLSFDGTHPITAGIARGSARL